MARKSDKEKAKDWESLMASIHPDLLPFLSGGFSMLQSLEPASEYQDRARAAVHALMHLPLDDLPKNIHGALIKPEFPQPPPIWMVKHLLNRPLPPHINRGKIHHPLNCNGVAALEEMLLPALLLTVPMGQMESITPKLMQRADAAEHAALKLLRSNGEQSAISELADEALFLRLCHAWEQRTREIRPQKPKHGRMDCPLCWELFAIVIEEMFLRLMDPESRKPYLNARFNDLGGWVNQWASKVAGFDDANITAFPKNKARFRNERLPHLREIASHLPTSPIDHIEKSAKRAEKELGWKSFGPWGSPENGVLNN